MEQNISQPDLSERHPGPSFPKLLIGLAVAVVIGGGFLYAAQSLQTWPFVSPTPSTNQETYTNDVYKFTLLYPKTWHYEECKDTGPDGIYLLVSLGEAQDLVVCNSDAPILGYANVTASPGKIEQAEIDRTFENIDSAKKKNVTIDGNAAVRVEGITRQLEGPGPQAGLTYSAIWTDKNGIAYRFIFIGEQQHLSKFDDVVETFKFGNCAMQEVQCIRAPCYPQLTCEESPLPNNDGGRLMEGTCPDEWIIDRMPTVGDDNTPNEYFIYQGRRYETFDFDREWVKANCGLEPQYVY